jgi:hypothetical protein
MGGGQSTIVNIEDVQDAIDAGKITVQEACKYVKCPPNREQFNNEYNNNDYLLVILITLLVFFIFVMSLILKKYI